MEIHISFVKNVFKEPHNDFDFIDFKKGQLSVLDIKASIIPTEFCLA